MKNCQTVSVAAFISAASVFGAPAAQAAALSTPSMAGPLAANPNPTTLDAGPLGNIYVTGVASGLALYQSNSTQSPGDHETLLDFTNGQVSIQKTDGFVQFYIQAGEYAFPSLGYPYSRATATTSAAFGAVPVAYLKLAPSDDFNIQIGKLPTLIGAEYTFSFQNLNIERGLLWNQEPAVSRGVLANYASGPLVVSLSWNDGAYTNKYNQLSGLLSYALTGTDTVSVAGSGLLGSVQNPFAPVANETVYNLIWTHIDGPFSITPYVQYTAIPAAAGLRGTATWGGAILANYAFDSNWSLGGRAEYIQQNGGFDPALYGSKSSAWSFTVTPTFQYKAFFARADFSYVTADSLSVFSSQGFPGPGFGTGGTNTDQVRMVVEVGILF